MSDRNWLDPWTAVVHEPDDSGDGIQCLPDLALGRRWERTGAAATCAYCRAGVPAPEGGSVNDEADGR